MSIYTPQGTPPVITNAMARIERVLPQPGEVLVRVGQRVEPEDVVAKALISAPPQITNVARSLGISPSQVESAMIREQGNKVAEGDVLARASRIGGRTCLASVSGIIADVDSETGYVTIAPDPQPYELYANVRGIVMEIIPYYGVVIETPAAQVQGVWGLGEERSGILYLLVTDPSDPIPPEEIDPKKAYSIIIGGSSINAAALKRAVQQNVRGIIVGGIEEYELRAFLAWTGQPSWQTGDSTWQLPNPQRLTDPGLTLIITEGFGVRPMSAQTFQLLTELDRQEALIEGHTSLRTPQRRPRVIAPRTASSSGQLTPPRPALQPGAHVRLVTPDQLGQAGVVRSISKQPRALPSGIRTQTVEVSLEDGQILHVPRTAIEVLA